MEGLSTKSNVRINRRYYKLLDRRVGRYNQFQEDLNEIDEIIESLSTS